MANSVSSLKNISAAKFPVLFKTQDYYACPGSSSFCAASLKLVPNNVKSEFWKQLEEWSRTRLHYNRTVVYRTLCIPQSIIYDDIETEHFVEDKINDELRLYNLSSKLYSLDCMKEKDYRVNIKLYIIILVLYVSLVLLATIYDEALYIEGSQSTLEKWLVCFSLKSYKKIKIVADYYKLKCIQGIRTSLTVSVIIGHSLLTRYQKNIENTEFVEEIYGHNMIQLLLIFGMSILQTFFVISSWFVTYQILIMHKENGRFTVTDAVLMFIHRIGRIWPALAFMIFVGLPIFNYFEYGPGSFEITNLINDACSKTWWVTFLQATNLLKVADVCHNGMWSLSVDSQSYLVILLFFYVILNYKLDIKKGIAILFMVSYVVNAVQIYDKKLRLDSLVSLKLATKLNFLTNDDVSYVYYGFWVNSGASIVGMLFGYFYFRSQQNEKKAEPYEKYYSIILVILPVLSILVTYVDLSRLATALIGPLLRPIFCFGIATGIYGVTRNVIRGFVKSIFENIYAVIIGNFTFSTYIFHFLWVFRRGAHSSSTVNITWPSVIMSSTEDVLASFLIGIIVTVMIEIPFVNLKKLILPPVWKNSKSTTVIMQSNGYNKNKEN